MNQFTMVPCSKCGNQVHVSPAMPVAYCPRCMSPVQAGQAAARPNMPGAPYPVVVPNNPAIRLGRPGGAWGIRLGVGGAIAAVIAVTVLKIVVGGAIPGMGHGTAPGNTKVSELGIDEKAADPDKMIANVKARALAWKKDAQFYSVNVLGLGPNGTVDLTDDGSVVTVEYFSPSAVASNSPEERKNAIKKFVFNSVGMSEDIWGVRERSDHVPATPIPRCPAKQIGQALAQKGLKAGKTAQLTLDPQFAFATDKLSYSVNMSDPKLQVWFDINSCAVVKELK